MRFLIIGMTCLAFAARSGAAVIPYTGQEISHLEGTATFSSIPSGSSLLNYSEAGLNISTPGTSWASLSDGVYYTGSHLNMVTITRLDGLDFSALEMQVGNGWGVDTTYIHAFAYREGVEVGSFSIDHAGGDFRPAGDFLGFRGQFDELRIVGFYQPLYRALVSGVPREVESLGTVNSA